MKKYQEAVEVFFRESGWKYWNPLSITVRLMEEVGEFARLVNHLHGEKKKKLDEPEQSLEDELGDILYTILCFANSHSLDLDRAISKSIDKVAKRDKDRFPSSL